MPCGYIRVTVSTANKHCINVTHQVTRKSSERSAAIYLHDSVSPLDLTVVNQIWAFRICGSRSETGWIFLKYDLSMKNVNRTVVHGDLCVAQDQHFLINMCRLAGWQDPPKQVFRIV